MRVTDQQRTALKALCEQTPDLMASQVMRDLLADLEEAQEQLDIRPEVSAFALAMEERLRANDHKGGWKACTFDYLIHRLGQEFAEFKAAFYGEGAFDPDEMRHEAADVANFLMMILDMANALAATEGTE